MSHTPTKRNPCKILLVDDDQQVLNLCKQALERNGLSVAAASGGGAATETFVLLGGVRLLITDLEMPGMGGEELATKLCALQPDLPVLFITGGHLFVERRTPPPQRHLLQKPFKIDALITLVKKIMLTN
jgi:DNA-binding NtrC family response regulator